MRVGEIAALTGKALAGPKDFAAIDIQAKEILSLRERMNEILAELTGQGADRIAADTERDYHMSSEEALKYGIVDQVMKSRPEAGDALAAAEE